MRMKMKMKRDQSTGCLSTPRPIVTKIVNKFQITVPGEIRALFDLQEGDLFEWSLNRENTLTLVPKRAQLITPLLDSQVLRLRAKRAKERKTQDVEARDQNALLPQTYFGSGSRDVSDEEVELEGERTLAGCS